MPVMHGGHGKKGSLQLKLIRLFLLTSSIPILIMSFFSYYNMSGIFNENVEEMTVNNLEQLRKNLHVSLESYEDLLYQIYTDDDVISMVDRLNVETDLPVTFNQLRRYLRSLLNAKKFIRSITIITSEGKVVTYDQLTSVTTENSWLSDFSLSQDELYSIVSVDNKTHVFSTEYGTSFASNDFYLFHMAHRLIDYKNLEKKSGIVIISIDEEFLRNICISGASSDGSINNFNFIVDDNGRAISYIRQDELTKRIVDPVLPAEDRKHTYTDFIKEQALFNNRYISITFIKDEELSWDIVNVSDQSPIMSKLIGQLEILIVASALSTLVAIGLTFLSSRRLTDSIKKVVNTMQYAGSGNWAARVEVDRLMPLEVESIAFQFNNMLDKLEQARMNEKEAGDKQRIAEIKALEARINPHFLYNTLDTINWMAIDKDEYDISNAISSLATILRYAIRNSNEMVTIRDELEWLKKYIFLQQIRLKNTFRCNMNIDPDIMECKIYKLLLQPFIENAIIHGFDGCDRDHVIDIAMSIEDENIWITIKDNGNGMDPALVEQINKGIYQDSGESNHVGLDNVISRLKIYYGDAFVLRIDSQQGNGTEIDLRISGRLC